MGLPTALEVITKIYRLTDSHISVRVCQLSSMLARLTTTMDLLDFFDDDGLPFVISQPLELSPPGINLPSGTTPSHPIAQNTNVGKPQLVSGASCNQPGSDFHDGIVNGSTFNPAVHGHPSSSSVPDITIRDTDYTSSVAPDQPHIPGHSNHGNHGIQKLDDFLSGVADFRNEDGSLTATDIHLLSDEDPQSKELEQVLKELDRSTGSGDHGDRYNGASTSIANMSNHMGDIPTGSNTHETCQSVSLNNELLFVPDKVKLHPTLTHILLHGVEKEEMYGPIVPLKDKTYSPTGDVDGSLLYMQNIQRIPITDKFAQKGAVNHHSTLSGRNRTNAQLTSSTVPQDTRCDAQIKVFSSPSSNMNTSCGTGGFPAGNNASLSPRAVHASPNITGSRMDRPRLSPGTLNHCSKDIVEKKNLYIRTTEETLAEMVQQNKKLICENTVLREDKTALQQEVSYLKNVLYNQSSISDILKSSPTINQVHLTGQFDNIKRKAVEKTSVCHASKKSRGCQDLEKCGLCIHIGADSNVASIEACLHCSQMAQTNSS